MYSTINFYTEQGPLDSQLDNKSYHQIIEVFSSGFKNAPGITTVNPLDQP